MKRRKNSGKGAKKRKKQKRSLNPKSPPLSVPTSRYGKKKVFLAIGACMLIITGILTYIGIFLPKDRTGNSTVKNTPGKSRAGTGKTTPGKSGIEKKARDKNQAWKDLIIPFKDSASETANKLKAENLRVASALFKEFPHKAEPFFLLGKIYRRHGNSKMAIESWNRALKLNPNHPDIYFNFGWIALEEGQYKKAIEYFNKVLKLAPEKPRIYFNIAKAQMGLGRVDKAIEALKHEIKITPGSAISHFLLGQQYLEKKEYKKAIESYKTAIKLDPKPSNPYYRMAKAFFALKQKKEGQKYLVKFRKLKKEEMQELKNQDSAFNDLSIIRKNLLKTHLEAGQIYNQEGNVTKAEEHWKRAAELNPGDISPRLALISLYQAKQPEKVIKLYKELVGINPKNQRWYMALGSCYLKAKDYKSAAEIFSKVTSLDPLNPQGYNQLALAYLFSKTHLPEAVTMVSKSVSLDPSARNYDLLGWALYANGNVTGALSALKKAMKIDPSNKEYKERYNKILQKVQR